MTNYEIASSILTNDFADITYPTEPGNVLTDIIQSPEQLMKSKKGHCWEQTELARHLLNRKNVPNKSYFLDCVCNDAGNTCTHALIVFESESCFYWFEHAWEAQRGIRRYDSLEELLSDVKNKFAAEEKAGGRPGEIFRMREYDAPNLPCPHMEYFYHCLKGREINVDFGGGAK